MLRAQVRRPLGLWTLRLVVAEQVAKDTVKILGEMKAWAYRSKNGLQLDTMRVNPRAPRGVGHLVWAATMAWALEATPCKTAKLLAIRDDEDQHERLVNYFMRRGFKSVRTVGSAPLDLPLRMIWGGAGSLMQGDCQELFLKSYGQWEASRVIVN